MSAQPQASMHESEIRDLIERWLRAVSDRRLKDILTDHSEDIVMFDVPLPDIHGIDEYRESWLRMFPYLGEHGSYEAKELTVTAGEDVAFCYGQLDCQESGPDAKLLAIRLTVGLRKRDGRWIVEHEHHSEAAK